MEMPERPSTQEENVVTDAERLTVTLMGTPVMRQQYRELSDSDKALTATVKFAGGEFYKILDALGNSRELSLAKTKIEEAVMWATKHITA